MNDSELGLEINLTKEQKNIINQRIKIEHQIEELNRCLTETSDREYVRRTRQRVTFSAVNPQVLIQYDRDSYNRLRRAREN